ncbi:MAG TPA: DUF2127 domain-containing protein, partial [Streptosporangiaceae bacterium]
MDWSLLACGARGHVTFAPEDPALRDRLSVPTRTGAAWRCLRCGTFVAGEPTATGQTAAAPEVRRDDELRGAFILRFFAAERLLRAVVFLVLAYILWRFRSSRASVEQAFNRDLPEIRELLRQLGFNVDHSKLLGFIQHAFTLNDRTLAWLTLGAAGYALIELIEGVGLWLLKRWGEYFAMVATSVGLPYEVYELSAKVTVLRVLAFMINLALVLYLVLTKRLFGVRGGKEAYEARLRSESLLQAEIDALTAEEAARSKTTAAAPTPASPAPASHGLPD